MGNAQAAATQSIVLGMGCFWGAEHRMAQIPGVVDVEVGYAGGDAETVTYDDVLRLERELHFGMAQSRNHAEVVRVTFDPTKVSVEEILMAFWENHDPTQGDRQGNDVGSNYRSAIYYTTEAQRQAALRTREVYQQALRAAGFGPITTEITPLRNYNRAEEYHQDYLRKHPGGYCGLGGTNVPYPGRKAAAPLPPDGAGLSGERQLIVYEAPGCPACARLRADIVDTWRAPIPLTTTTVLAAPQGWKLKEPVTATPTVVLFERGEETARFTGYRADPHQFWRWLGQHILSPEEYEIAFQHGTERPFSCPLLEEKRPGTYVDPLTGAPLFRSETKFSSGTGWPSFLEPVPGAITQHEDTSFGMRRTEVRSASSGIHLGHVFDDGPAPTGKRYCINGAVLRFVPDPQ